VHRESVESPGQFVRHRQLGRVICVKFNDVGARVLRDHAPLQWWRDSPISRAQRARQYVLPDKQRRLRHRTEFPIFGCATRAILESTSLGIW
jgi:hypothetical protein